MNAARDLEQREAVLDACIDRLITGRDWQMALPPAAGEQGEVPALMQVAERLLALARVTAGPEMTRRERIRKRLQGPRNIILQLAFYRLPYLPPLWIKPEAC